MGEHMGALGLAPAALAQLHTNCGLLPYKQTHVLLCPIGSSPQLWRAPGGKPLCTALSLQHEPFSPPFPGQGKLPTFEETLPANTAAGIFTSSPWLSLSEFQTPGRGFSILFLFSRCPCLGQLHFALNTESPLRLISFGSVQRLCWDNFRSGKQYLMAVTLF